MEIESDIVPGQPTTTKNGKYIVKIDTDDYSESPRQYDNLGTMVCLHRRHRLGDVSLNTMEELDSWYSTQCPNASNPKLAFEAENMVLPLSMLDHSGLTIWIGHPPHPCDPGGWDSGRIGFIYVSHERLRREYSRKRLHKSVMTEAEKVLEAEVETYNQYLSGDCWCYAIVRRVDADTEFNASAVEDSCCGLLGWNYAIKAINEALEALDKQTQEGK